MKKLIAILSLLCAASVHGQHLSNLSTRGIVGTGDQVMIAGLIIVGDGSKAMIVRALGPTLGQFGVQGVLGDPILEVYDSQGTLIAFNDDWQDDFYWWTVSELGFAPSDPFEAVIYRPFVPAGSYTIIVRGYNDTVGIALVEVYDLAP